MKCRDSIDYGSAGVQVLSSALVAILSLYHRAEELGDKPNLALDKNGMIKLMCGVSVLSLLFICAVVFSGGKRYGNETAEFYAEKETDESTALLNPNSNNYEGMLPPPSRVDISSALFMSAGIGGIAAASTVDFFHIYLFDGALSSLSFLAKMGTYTAPFAVSSYAGFLYQFLLKTPFNYIPDDGFLGWIKRQIIKHPYLIIRFAVLSQMILIGATGFKQCEKTIPEGVWRSLSSYGVTPVGAICFYFAYVYSGLKGVKFLDATFNIESPQWVYHFEVKVMQCFGKPVACGATIFKLFTSFLSISPAVEYMINGLMAFFGKRSISIASPWRVVIPAAMLLFSTRALYAKLAPKKDDSSVAANSCGFLLQLKNCLPCNRGARSEYEPV